MSLSIPRAVLRRIASSRSSFASILSPSYRVGYWLTKRPIPLFNGSATRQFACSTCRRSLNVPAARIAYDTETSVEDYKSSTYEARAGTVAASTSGNGSILASKSGIDGESLEFEQEIKSIVQHIPYAIVVLTTGEENDTDSWRGMTLSSFTTISMRPTPLATINIKTPSHTLSQLLHSKKCVINVLLRNKDGIKCASTFANPNSPISAQREQFSRRDSGAVISSNEETHKNTYYGPSLREDAVYISLDCFVRNTIPVQDHTLVILKIARANGGSKTGSLRDYEALFYKRRDYDLLSEGTKESFFPGK